MNECPHHEHARRGVVAIFALLVGSSVVSSAFVPLAPEYASELGLTPLELGAAFAAATLPMLVAAAPLGLLGDRISAKAVTVAGSALLTSATAGHALAFDFASLLASRLAFGLGTAMLWTAGLAWLAALGEERSRARSLTGTASAAGAGVAFGPLYAGVMADAWSLRAPFVASTAVLAIAVLALACAPSGERAPHDGVPLIASVRELLAHGPLVAAAVALALSGLAQGATNLVVPLQLEANGWGPAAIGLALTLTTGLFTLGSLLVARMGDRAASLRASAGGAFVLACACVVTVAGTSAFATMAFLVFRVPGWVVLATAPYAIVAVFAGGHGLGFGVVIGILTQLWAATSSVAPLAAAGMLDLAGAQAAFAALGAVSLLIAGWLLTQPPSTRRPPREVTA